MKFFKTSLAICLALLSVSCGFLSNSHIWDGYGLVSGRLTADGQPLEGALVFVQGEPERRMTTTADGIFEIATAAGKGRHLVAVWGGSLGIRQAFDLAGEAHQDLGDIELAALGALQGKVSLQDPAEAEISVAGTSFVARPDGAGSYQLLLPGGRWNLTLSAAGHLAEEIESIKVSSGDSDTIETVTLSQDPEYSCNGSEWRSDRFTQGGGGAMDILFVVDNSGSMVGEQQNLATSFEQFAAALEAASVDFHVAVVTTGMKSPGCPDCSGVVTASCMNETGESGRFQDRLGKNLGSVDYPDFDFIDDPACRVVNESNLDCFYDRLEGRGTVMVGVNGCGYERGLAAMRKALGELTSGYNQGFLRSWARLAVIVVSDEDDCGEVGDVLEDATWAGGEACYYAAKGVDPEGNSEDPDGRPLRLTPVADYAGFLRGLKPVGALATFSAIVGVSDPDDPASTTIEYEWNEGFGRWNIASVCSTPGCTGSYCSVGPGTRYIEMARLTGGVVDTLCQADFSAPMLEVAGVTTGYRSSFKLGDEPLYPESIEVYINAELVSEGWQYQPESREIVFDEGHCPKPYALLEIRYETACD